MKTSLVATFLLIVLGWHTDASAARVLTLYLDGARVEQRETARKGYLEISLPPGATFDSLRIAPDKGVEIRRVVTLAQKPDKRVARELAQLAEREEQLSARLKALAVREEIYKAAAKSQSAKAPRRTKTNPEPISVIKKGTDFAIAQLETVYQAKRSAEKELTQIGERRVRLGNEKSSAGIVARVWVAPSSGGVTFSWSESGRYWQPHYQLRVDDTGRGNITVMPQPVVLAKGESAYLVFASLQDPGNPLKFRYESDWSVLRKEEFAMTGSTEAVYAPQSFSFVNSSAMNFPPGVVSCFKTGVYVGQGDFKGIKSGKQGEIICSGSRK
jgi:hypothetical protein